MLTRRRFFTTGAGASLLAGCAAEAAPADTADEHFGDENVSLNGAWLFRLDPDEKGEQGGWSAGDDPAGWREVRVPHTWQVEPENTEYRGVAWYRRTFEAPRAWSERAVRVEFEAVFHTATVWVNGKEAGRHIGKGYTAFTFDIDHLLRFGAPNLLAVKVDNAFNESMLPRGRSSDWAHDGGIYRPVRLLVTPKVFIERVDVDAEPDLSARTAAIAISAVVRNTSQQAWNGRVGYRVTDEAAGNPVLAVPDAAVAQVAAGGTKTIALPAAIIREPRLWHFDRPDLYSLNAGLGEGHSLNSTFGIRKIEIRNSAFYLNGERVRPMGVERMAGSNPEYGMAEPPDWIEHDLADMKELNCVYTRVHWPQDRAVLDWCDRHGMFIQTEVPAWGSATFRGMTNEPSAEIMNNGLEQLREMIARDRNHPCIFSWGVCNETGGQNPPAYYALAAIACRRGDFELAMEHLDESLENGAGNLKARNLKTAILRRMGRRKKAEDLVGGTAQADPLDAWSRYESAMLAGGDAFQGLRLDPQTSLDVAYDLAEAGLWDENVLDPFLAADGPRKAHPMIFYALGHFAENRGDAESAAAYRARGAEAPPDYCFPARIDDMLALESALRANPGDARAHYYLGNLLYDKRRRAEAIRHWEQTCRLEPGFSIPWRNLGMACFNVLHDAVRAAECYERARAANPDDARLLYEFDQLRKRTGVPPEERLAALRSRPGLVEQRDDLTVELASLYNQTGRSETALEVLGARRFHPWEGGEGAAPGQYLTAHVLLGCKRLEAGDAAAALDHFEAARSYPRNLGEGKGLLTEERHLDYFSGLALASLGIEDDAHTCWDRAAAASTTFNFQTYFRGLALAALGREGDAGTLFQELRTYAEGRMESPVETDYFATSLPNFLLFDDGVEKRNRAECLFLHGLANRGLGRMEEACEDYKQALLLDRNHVWAQEALRSAGESRYLPAALRRR